MSPLRSCTVGIAALAALAGQLPAQEPAAGGAEQPAVFLDCQFGCDFDFIRTETPWVDWMRDRADAQVHVLVRTQPTGGGGREYTLEFLGLREFAGRGEELRYIAGRDNSSDDTRRGLTRTLQLGLAGFAAQTPVGERLSVRLAAGPGTRPAGAAPARDPWNHWNFSLGGNGFLDGESTRSAMNLGSNARASRVTDAWKLDFRVNGSYREQAFTLAEPAGDRRVVSVFRNYGANSLIVRSVTDHLSVGGRASLTTSTFGNTRHSLGIAPAIEYNVYPYAESTRRSFTVLYAPGLVSQAYREETIFDQLEETRFQHSLTLGYSTRQPWGNVNLSVNGSQFLHDTDLFQVVFFGGPSLNLFRGLRLNLTGNYAMIRDQLSLPRRDATPEEVLLRQRQLRTNYRYFANFGLSYQFGSAVQNIVNPRFTNTGGGVIIFE
jgi:hypothetical protein